MLLYEHFVRVLHPFNCKAGASRMRMLLSVMQTHAVHCCKLVSIISRVSHVLNAAGAELAPSSLYTVGNQCRHAGHVDMMVLQCTARATM